MSAQPTTQPPSSPPRAGVALGPLWLIGVAAALFLYVATLAPDLVWQDPGDYQLQAHLLNLSRPGDAVRVHPWFMCAAHALEWMGFKYPYAANLASAIGTALAVGNVLLLVRLMTGRLAAAVVAAVSLALAHAVWYQGVIAQTYGWTAAFLSAECLCAWAFLERRRPVWLLLLAFVNGVAISNHMMAALSLAVFAVWAVWLCVRGRAPWWVLAAGAACWLAGGALYWGVLEQEYARSGSLLATFHSATVGQWGAGVFNVDRLPRLLLETVLYMGLNYPTPLIIAIPVGAVLLGRRRDSFGRLLLVLATVYLVWAARYDVVDRRAFFIPFCVLSCVMIGVAAARWLEHSGRAWLVAVLLVAAVLPVGVYEMLPTMGPPILKRLGLDPFRRTLPFRNSAKYFFRPWKQGDEGARRFAEAVMQAVPDRAIVLADSTSAAPLMCLQRGEGRRPDVLLVSKDFGLDPEVMRYWTSTTDMLPQAAAEGRRVFVVSNHPDYMPLWVKQFARVEPALVVNADTGVALLYEVKPRAQEAAP